MATSKAPKHLSASAKKWWGKLQSDYSIDDEAGFLLLQTALEAYDRMKQVAEQIKKDGPQVKDRFDQLKAHPLLTVERDSRAQMLAALKALNLDTEPLRSGPGRPPGR